MKTTQNDLAITYKFNKEGGFEVLFSIPESEDIVHTERIAHYLAKLVQSINSASMLQTTLKCLGDVCRKKKQANMFLYNAVSKELTSFAQHAIRNQPIVPATQIFK